MPTADLEELRPLLPDEAAYGITYEQIDDFLEGKPGPPEAVEVIRRGANAIQFGRSFRAPESA